MLMNSLTEAGKDNARNARNPFTVSRTISLLTVP